MTHVGPDGKVQATLNVPGEPDETLGSFLLVPDGFVTATYLPATGQGGKLRGCVARLDADGVVAWSTIIPAGTIAYAGVEELGVDTGWQPQSMQAWQPADWQTAWRGEPLLLSGDRLLTRYFELRSGLGTTFCLHWPDGRILWSTESRPEAGIALLGRDEFLLGVLGYGAFDLHQLDRDGKERQRWASYADVVVTEAGQIQGVEMDNRLPSRMHFSVFERDGTVRKGPHLDGYHTIYPLVNRRGATAFWRQGKLHTVDASLVERTLWEDPSLSGKAVMTRMLLADDGTLVFGLEDELFVVSTDLRPMADIPWPCGSGNARGNPAFLGPPAT